MIRLVPLLLMIAACAPREAPPSSRAAAAGATPELLRICSQEAERIVNYRERGQLMRMDSSFGESDMNNDVPSARLRTEAYQQQTMRDELIREGVRNAGSGPAPIDASGQRPAPRARR